MYNNTTTRHRLEEYLNEFGTTKTFFAEQCGVPVTKLVSFLNGKHRFNQDSLVKINNYIDRV